jgi:hypothetical protein
VTTVDVVYVPVVGGDSDLADIVAGDDGRDALERAGYRVGDDDGDPPLPRRNHLPEAGVLEALLQTWRQVTG